MKTLLKLIIVIPILFVSCKNDPSSDSDTANPASIVTDNKENLNISILLDLSDRIDTIKYHNETMQFYQRDIRYIESVSNYFVDHLKQKRVRTIDDRISLYFDPEPNNANINSISKDLNFHITRNNASLEKFEEIKSYYNSKPEQIYNLAINDAKYPGSNTWGFFKNKVKDYCLEEGYKNILVILTDGYMFHKDYKRKEGNLTSYLTPAVIRDYKLNSSDWKMKMNDGKIGFIPANENLENLNVLVLGLNPDKKNVYEDEIIKSFWENWLKNMGVKHAEFRNAELPSNMDGIIHEFILKS